MKLTVTVFIAFFLLLIPAVFCAGADAAPAYPSPPQSLLEYLSIKRNDIIKNEEKFRKNPTHTEWMSHVQSTLPGIDPDKEAAIVQIHLSLLYIKQKMDQAYAAGRMGKPEFTTRLSGLMQWFQDANGAVFSEQEYRLVFGKPDPDESASAEGISDGDIGFPIHNPEISPEKIKEQFDSPTIVDLNRFYRQQSQELRDIKRIYETNDFGNATKWQVLQDMLRIEKELNAAFKRYCRERLTQDEFQLLFGNGK